jgi:signal transduction histidine kinase
MRRLKALILVFAASLTIPLGYFVWRTWLGLAREERAELGYFAETLFDRMEADLAEFVRQEEARRVEEYNVTPDDQLIASTSGEGPRLPALAGPPAAPYVVGYLQNNPDGSFQSPGAWDVHAPTPDDNLTAALDEANEIFNKKRSVAAEAPSPPLTASPKTKQKAPQKQAPGPADRYFNVEDLRKPKSHLGQESSLTQQITPDQARIVTRDGRKDAEVQSGRRMEEDQVAAEVQSLQEEALSHEMDAPGPGLPDETRTDTRLFKVEVAPMQTVFLDDDRVFIYRRVLIDHQVYRQGAVIRVRDLLDHLADTYFNGQPMAAFTRLTLSALDQGREATRSEVGVPADRPIFTLDRTFPRPFGFLRARLASDDLPGSPARNTLMAMSLILFGVVLAGLFAIYRSARMVVELSERRTGFVSSVTHELKTPLTNIRMYIEMLDQGLAQDPEREQEYFRVLDSETARLGRLINNVLEFSKIESKNRKFNLQPGNFSEVIREAAGVMSEKIRQEGFNLHINADPALEFSHDREVMVQVLINLMENSLKFGRTAPLREITLFARMDGDQVLVGVSDTGPGIPSQALKKVFEDFYRVDNSLTQTTRGTGIGLALVKKLVEAMGGKVLAKNNTGPGCTIEIRMPAG